MQTFLRPVPSRARRFGAGCPEARAGSPFHPAYRAIEHLPQLSAKDTDLPDAAALRICAREIDTLAIRGVREVSFFRRVIREANGFAAGHLAQPDVRRAAVVGHEDKGSAVRG